MKYIPILYHTDLKRKRFVNASSSLFDKFGCVSQNDFWYFLSKSFGNNAQNVLFIFSFFLKRGFSESVQPHKNSDETLFLITNHQKGAAITNIFSYSFNNISSHFWLDI